MIIKAHDEYGIVAKINVYEPDIALNLTTTLLEHDNVTLIEYGEHKIEQYQNPHQVTIDGIYIPWGNVDEYLSLNWFK